LSEYLPSEIFGDVSVLIDLAEAFGHLFELVVEKQEIRPSIVSDRRDCNLRRVLFARSDGFGRCAVRCPWGSREDEINSKRQLKIDAFSAGCSANEDTRAVFLPKATFGCDFGAVVTTSKHDDALAGYVASICVEISSTVPR